MNYPLVMTAAIDPKGMSGLSVNDIAVRRTQYLETFRFYLERQVIPQIVFVENSGADLTDFKELSEKYPQTEMEFIQADCNDYPRHLGKSYGEMLILDHIVDFSELVKTAEGFIKVTGRFPILNIAKLLKEAEKRQPWQFFCDCKDHKIYDWLRLGWNGHSCDTRFFIVTTNFYREHFYGRYTELDDSQEKLIETMFFHEAMKQNPGVIRRFHTEPEYSGKAGHVQTALLQVNDYSSRIAKAKRRIRQMARWIMPWFWF